jgi:plastocyanin
MNLGFLNGDVQPQNMFLIVVSRGFLLIVACIFATASGLKGQTSALGTNLFQVSSGVAFEIGNIGTSSYTFSWNDGTSFTQTDPSLVLLVGQTYTFTRTSSAHPLLITTDAMDVDTSGGDGFFTRTSLSNSASEIDPFTVDFATLGISPDDSANFLADPSPTTDSITWTPTLDQVGDYFYTCQVTGHLGMTGGITVAVPEPSQFSLFSGALISVAILLRRRQQRS